MPIGEAYPELGENALLVAITERRTREQIDRLAEVLGEAVAGSVGSERSGDRRQVAAGVS